MKVLNFGSLNVDYVYKVNHMTMEGETQKSQSLEIFAGGKGLNQSIALAKAGVDVFHAGIIGEDGEFLLNTCAENGINTDFIKKVDGKNGHAIIQVDKNAQNCILLYDGTNGKVTKDFVDEVLSNFEANDILILQNEVNMIDYIIDKAFDKSMTIILNPSPFNSELLSCDLSKISIFIMNEIEGAQIYGKTGTAEEILDFMMMKYPNSKVVMTIGKDGSHYRDKNISNFQPIFKVDAVDTTAAGDTYTGYFIKCMLEKYDIKRSMEIASRASSLAVSKMGASSSIPTFEEVINSL